MTAGLVDAPRPVDEAERPDLAPSPRRPAYVRTVLGAVLVLLACYALLSAFTDARGTLGTDTGGKLASLDAMDRNGGLDPDLGYWAEALDPDGDLHPLYYTSHVGDRWVNLTTLPMPVLAAPLYDFGGERAVLLLPMLGSALAALAARALARRLASRDDAERVGWWAFWLVGLASPLTLYALDFWEHSLGVAALVWAAVLALDVVERRAGWRRAFAVGLLVGLAATMRTEALVYGLVFGAAAALVLARRRTSTAELARLAGAAVGGVAIALAANQLLERLVLGESLRAGRAAGTAAAGGSGVSQRLDEALTTFVGVNRFGHPLDWVVGALAACAVAYGAWRIASSRDRDGRVLGLVAIGVAAVLYLLRFADGLGFVPGLLVASPLAAAGVGLGLGRGDRRQRAVVGVALAALPIVWIFQYSGGAAPQWGARYALVSGALLAVVAAVQLARVRTRAAGVVVVLALLVTASGVAWLAQRSHAVADGMEAIVARGDDVLISREAHLLREGGAFARPGQHWLTATDPAELRRAVTIAAASGADRVGLLTVEDGGAPARLGPYRRGAREQIELLPGVLVTATTYRRG